jgi:hypothetical protein
LNGRTRSGRRRGIGRFRNTHPELLEALTDFFIRNNYQFRPLFRLLVTSDAYQLSSRDEGGAAARLRPLFRQA